MATPCDGIKECRDRSDEAHCEENMLMLVVIVMGLIILTIGIYNYLKWYVLGWKRWIAVKEDSFDESYKYSNLIGNDLAKLKVG